MSTPLYIAGGTWLHRASAKAKLAGLAVLGTAAFLVASPYVLVPGALVSALVLATVGAPPRRLAQLLTGTLILVAAVAALAAWSDGLVAAIVVAARLCLIVFAAFAVTLSTRTSDMLAAIEELLAPLDRRGLVDAARVSLAVSLVLRFVPDILTRWRDIREAQAARGLASHPLALLVPLLVRTLKGADDVAAAIEARGFPPPRSTRP